MPAWRHNARGSATGRALSTGASPCFAQTVIAAGSHSKIGPGWNGISQSEPSPGTYTVGSSMTAATGVSGAHA
jgi:hypothetical protein